jgi:hypothetical protein
MFDFLLFLLGMVPWPIWVVLALCLICTVQFLWGWRAALGAAIALLPLAGYFWGRKEGSQIEKARQSKARDILQEHYDEIDRQDIDPSGSYDRLRGLSDDKDRR